MQLPGQRSFPITNPSKSICRGLLSVVLLISLGLVGINGVGADIAYSTEEKVHHSEQVSGAVHLTVVTTHFDDDRDGAIAAFDDEGNLVYQNSSYTRYFDVDPVHGNPFAVIYVAEQNVGQEQCGIQPASGWHCVIQIVEELNLQTDTVDVIFRQTIPVPSPDSWHDVDRINGPDLLVADIHSNRAFVVDSKTRLISWAWMASTHFSRQSGGPVDDWTHLNDVELIQDETVMISLRNQDQIVFVDRETGLRGNWTLGRDDEHDILYEQHNPDYIPLERGGPAVLVADSENNRIIEYQRSRGDWVETWVYSDDKMEWPRDADRLPNGNTLITDTHSNRVFEINRDNSIAWQIKYPKPYEAERLDTGDESSGGESADRLGLERQPSDADPGAGEEISTFQRARQLIVSAVPEKIRHGIEWVLPAWAGFLDAMLFTLAGLTVLIWAIVELHWTSRIDFRSPITLK